MAQQVQLNVDPNTLKDRVCSKCGRNIFTHALTLKELPPLLSPSGKCETMMVKIGFVCVGCGCLLSLRPEEPKAEDHGIVLAKR